MGKKKHYSYFKGYLDCANCSSWAAKALDKVILDYSAAKAQEGTTEIHGIEHESDNLKHKMMEHLASEFLPPIERPDITRLMDELDNVVDGIDEVMMLLNMYKVEQVREDVPGFSHALVRCCDALCDLVDEFGNFKKSKSIKAKIILVNSLEAEADTLYFDAVSTLLSSCKDPVEIMKWKDIYKCFEECFDACECTADTIEEIILANS